jgi:hypothetical protein
MIGMQWRLRGRTYPGAVEVDPAEVDHDDDDGAVVVVIGD